MTGLTELGFHWRVCVEALSTSGGDVEAAANALFTMEHADTIVSEWEVGRRLHRASFSVVCVPVFVSSYSSTACGLACVSTAVSHARVRPGPSEVRRRHEGVC